MFGYGTRHPGSLDIPASHRQIVPGDSSCAPRTGIRQPIRFNMTAYNPYSTKPMVQQLHRGTHAQVRKFTRALLPLALLLAATCTDGGAVGPRQGGRVQLSIVPRFAAATTANPLPVNRIVLNARDAGGTAVLGSRVYPVDPNAQSWELSLDVQLPGNATVSVYLTLELMHVEGTTQTVEWSGVTTVAVAPGENKVVTSVQLYPGPLAPVATVVIDPNRANLRVGNTLLLNGVARDERNNVLLRIFTWTSSDTSRAVVSSTGVVNGKTAGEVTITGTLEGKSATATITVYTPIATTIRRVSGDAQVGTVATGLPNPLVVAVLDDRGEPMSGQVVQWVVTAGGGTVATTSATTDASGSTQTRATLGPQAGNHTFEARAAGLTGSPVVFTATAVASSVNNVTVSPATKTLVAGDTATLTATARDAANAVIPAVAFAWSSSDSTIAKVNGTGLVTARLVGVATISATANGKSGSASVSVSAGGAAALSGWSGSGQSGLVGAPLRDSLFAHVTDRGQNPVSGVTVQWVVTSGGGSVNPVTAVSDARGLAATRWTLGSLVSTQTVEARASTLSGSPVIFIASGSNGIAVRKTWIGGDASDPTNWSVAGNWQPAGVPAASDTAVIPGSAPNQPSIGGVNPIVGGLIVQSGANLHLAGYSLTVLGNVDVAGAVTEVGSLTMTGNNVTVRGSISNLETQGSAIANGQLIVSGGLRVAGGNFTLNGQTVVVQGDFSASSGTITMTNANDVLTVQGSATFYAIDETAKLTAGKLNLAGDLVTGCSNSTEFVSTGTAVSMNGLSPQAIKMDCGSSLGSRFYTLAIQAGAKVSTSSNPLFVATTLSIGGTFTIGSAGVVDVAGPVGSVAILSGGALANGGALKANLPIVNMGTLTGNAAVQR